MHRIGKKESPECWYCRGNVADSPDYTLFYCTRWDPHRLNLNLEMGETIDIDNIGRLMLQNERNFGAVNKFITCVMKQKIKDETDLP